MNIIINLFFIVIYHVDEKLPDHIKVALRNELEKDIFEYDECGYIYVFRGIFSQLMLIYDSR